MAATVNSSKGVVVLGWIGAAMIVGLFAYIAF